MSSSLVSTVYLTTVLNCPPTASFDTFFPKLLTSDWEIEDVGGGEKEDKKSSLKYKFMKYTKPEEGGGVNPEEMQVRGGQMKAGTRPVMEIHPIYCMYLLYIYDMRPSTQRLDAMI
jgi:hypothetical protein